MLPKQTRLLKDIGIKTSTLKRHFNFVFSTPSRLRFAKQDPSRFALTKGKSIDCFTYTFAEVLTSKIQMITVIYFQSCTVVVRLGNFCEVVLLKVARFEPKRVAL